MLFWALCTKPIVCRSLVCLSVCLCVCVRALMPMPSEDLGVVWVLFSAGVSRKKKNSAVVSVIPYEWGSVTLPAANSACNSRHSLMP